MMAAFAEMVEIFGRQGIAVIPTAPDRPSMPMVKNPEAFGVRASLSLRTNPRFAEANAGIWAGRRSNLTIVDIDSKDPEHTEQAIKRFGDTPVKVMTPSGGTHLYYRYGGERRRIRPLGDSFPIDLLGGGLAAIPPSERRATATKAGGVYRLIEGRLDDLSRLPTLRPLSLREPTIRAPDVGLRRSFSTLREGDGRDSALFDYARTAAHRCGTFEELQALVQAKNAEMAEPLALEVAAQKAAQAWRYKQEGRLLVPGARAAIMSREVRLACSASPSAFFLLAYLKEEHSLDHEFALVPEAVAPHLEWRC